MKDSYGREITYLRVSVTERCNLRCRYCMPEDGIQKQPHSAMLTEEELLAVIREAARLGIRKVRFTGGEPLIKKNILSIIEKTAQTDGIDEVVLTTNGTLLAGMAADLKSAGISRVNISLDTLSEEKYRAITRVGTLKDALSGLDAALNTGFERVKLNTVLIGGFNTDEIASLAELTRSPGVDVRFIELMPIQGANTFQPDAFVPSSAVPDALPQLQAAGHDGVAALYRLPGAKGRVGLISPVSCGFCDSCNRLRLTADGHLLPCLHSPLSYALKGVPREELHSLLTAAILSKPAGHGALSPGNVSGQTRAMNRIGG